MSSILRQCISSLLYICIVIRNRVRDSAAALSKQIIFYSVTYFLFVACAMKPAFLEGKTEFWLNGPSGEKCKSSLPGPRPSGSLGSISGPRINGSLLAGKGENSQVGLASQGKIKVCEELGLIFLMLLV